MSPPLSVRDLMSTDVETVGPAALLRAVAEHLYGTGVGSVVVTDDEGVPVGIVTSRDLSQAVAEGANLDQERVAGTMTEQLVTVGPDTTAGQAAATMRTHAVHHLIVLENDGLAGVLTATDLAYALPHLEETDRQPTVPPVDPGELYDATDWRFEGRSTDSPVDAGEATLAVGETFGFEKTLSDADVEAFAKASGDTNPLHLDDEYARETRFGGRIAHGLLTAGVVSAAVARLPGMIIYLGQDCEFTAPVRPGERVRVELEVVESLGDGQFRLQTLVIDSDERVVLDGEARVLVDEQP
ncbi:MaoC/PaaZ C-terminal domain-containing protein [Halosegnis sp.]|uniref:MaoC/PaaZ C-terminal domain-containing protein n=1 Tax=Halosegnis sp. TaxID=2864959 RepID=UPI0035D4AF4F